MKEILDTRVFLTRESTHNLGEAFRLLGKQPVQSTTTRLRDVFVEDFRREHNEIPSPQLKALYIIHKARELVQLQVSPCTELIVMAEWPDLSLDQVMPGENVLGRARATVILSEGSCAGPAVP